MINPRPSYEAKSNFRKNITFPRTIRSIPREKYNLFFPRIRIITVRSRSLPTDR